MNFILNRAAIKAEARKFIGDNTRWWKMILATFAVLLLNGEVLRITKAIAFIPEFATVYYPFEARFSFSSTLIPLLIIPFSVAVAGYYLNHIRGFNPTWKSLYKEGFDNYGKYFITEFLLRIFLFLWTLLLVVPGIIMFFAYSQAKYIIHDNPKLSPIEAIKISKIITNGYKGDLFLMQLSFIGWRILSAFTVGILYIYVIPYIETTSAMYYENLKSNAINSGLVAPEAFGINPFPVSENNQSGNYGEFNAVQAPNFYSDSEPTANGSIQNQDNSTIISPEKTFDPGETDDNI